MTWEAAQKRPGKATGSGVASTSQHQPLAPVQREPGSELGAPRDSIRESSHWERRRSWKNEAHHDSPSAVFSMTESSAGISKRPSSWWRGAIDQKLREGAQRPRGTYVCCPHPTGLCSFQCSLSSEVPRHTSSLKLPRFSLMLCPKCGLRPSF